MIDRREMLAIAGAAAVVGSNSPAQACSPAPDPGAAARAFFLAIAKREYASAMTQLSGSCRLTVITFQKAEMFEGQRNIVGTISNLIHTQGFHMFGDTRKRPTGGSWEPKGGWLCTDLLRGPTMNFDSSTCGGPGVLSDPIFNAKVQENVAKKIELIVLLGSYELSRSIAPVSW